MMLLCSCSTIKWTSNQVACPDFSTKRNDHAGLKGAKATRQIEQKNPYDQLSMKAALPATPLSKQHITARDLPLPFPKERKQIITQSPTPEGEDDVEQLSFIEKTAFFLLGIGITSSVIYLTSLIWPIAMVGVVPLLSIYTIIRLTQDIKEKEELVHKGILFGIILALIAFLIAAGLILIAVSAI